MRSWLRERLVCPRDHAALRWDETKVECEQGHAYMIARGIPILLASDEPSTQPSVTASIREQAAMDAGPGGAWSGEDGVHPFVQGAIAATNGIMYRPLIGKLTRYPIPELRLPDAAGSTLLDIGCNWGRWSVAAARKGYRAVGIDHSFPAVSAARDVARQLGVEAEFLVADGRRLPFRSASLDVVFSYSVLQHFAEPDCARAVSEVGRVLVSGGTSLIQMANRYGARSLYHQTRRGFRQARDFEVRYRSPKQILSIFSAGIGPSSLSVDGFFGLGIQRTDMDILSRRFRLVVAASEGLRRTSRAVKLMAGFADSLYVASRKVSA